MGVFAPRDAPRAKLAAIARHHAVLHLESSYDASEAAARTFARQHGLPFVSPYNDAGVIAGAGTIALEVFDVDASPDTIVVPVGGGGLISGVAIAARAISETVSILGVEVEASQAFTKSLAAGHIVPIEVGPTLADGLAGNLDPDAITFDIVRRLVLGIVRVDERGLQDGIAGIAREERLIAEAAGAAAAAGVLSGRIELDGRLTAVILSGGNIDVEKLKTLI